MMNSVQNIDKQELEIIHVVRDVHPYGGIGGVVYYLHKATQEMEISSTLLTIESVIGFLKPVRHEKSLWIKALNLFLMILHSFAGSIAMLFRKKPSRVFIVHNDAIGGDIFVDHGCHKAVVKQRPSMILRNPVHIFLLLREELRHLMGGYKRVVVLSDMSRKVFETQYPRVPKEKYVKIPNGVDIKRFTLENRKPDTPGALTLVFVGHEFERKGLSFILEAMPDLPETVRLTVVGGTEQDIEFAKKDVGRLGIRERVEFLGKRTDVPDILRQSDAMIMPSRSEAWQLVALEGMACGLPYFSTRVGCAEEIIQEGVTGYLIERDSKDIAAKIQALYDKGEGIAKMRLATRRTAESYSWDSIAERYVALAREVAAEKNA
jgi:UDP-glucose:(heptosyl)LPS alpha-1,3-glucosyltransferase